VQKKSSENKSNLKNKSFEKENLSTIQLIILEGQGLKSD
jgi:hypothetical protein